MPFIDILMFKCSYIIYIFIYIYVFISQESILFVNNAQFIIFIPPDKTFFKVLYIPKKLLGSLIYLGLLAFYYDF